MRIPAALLISLLCAAPACAGLFDLISLPSGRSDVPADVAEKLATEYLTKLLHIEDWKVSNGRGDLTGAEKKSLDRHVTSRLDRGKQLVVADLTSPRGKGTLVISGSNLTEVPWDPAKGYMAYISMETELVFPGDADRATALVTHLVGEKALFGFAPEAGPLWRVVERYLSRSYSPGGQAGGPGQAQFSGDYQVQSGEVAPEADEIPAWVVRGIHDLKWGEAKPAEMGLLVALTRRPNSSLCRLTHVTGIGTLGKTLFKDGQRLNKESEE